MARKATPSEQAAEQAAADVADAADDGEHQQREAEEDVEAVEVDRAQLRRHRARRRARDGGREHEHRQLEPHDVHAEGGARRRAVLQRGEPAAVAAVAQRDRDPTPSNANRIVTARGTSRRACRSSGPIFGRGIDEVAAGEDREAPVEQRQLPLADLGQHEAGHEHAEGHRRQREVEAAQPQRGKGHERADERAHHRGEDVAPERRAAGRAAAVGAEVEDDDRADGAERHGGQVDLAAVAGEQHEREGDDRQGHAERQRVRSRVGAMIARSRNTTPTSDDAPTDGACGRSASRNRSRVREHGRAPQPVLGQHEQDDEQQRSSAARSGSCPSTSTARRGSSR